MIAAGPWQVRLQDGALHARVTFGDIQIKVDQTEFKSWEQDGKKLFQEIAQTYVNDTYLDGLPIDLPLSADTLTRTSVNFCKDAMYVLGGFAYVAENDEEGR